MKYRRSFLVPLLSDMIFILLISATYLICSVNASAGIYKTVLRSKYNSKLPNSDSPSSQANSTTPAEDPSSQVPPLISNPHLEIIDEIYSRCNGIDIRELPILQIQALFDANKLTSVDITKCYMERIKRTNDVLRVVNEINPDALSEAAKADWERKLGIKGRSLMHGIPVLIKQNIGTGDRMETSAGSLALMGFRAIDDADVVKALRKSGAVILGKGNLSEFAYFRGTNIPEGWSGRGGQTRNAYNLNVTPEGSSSGPAVAVSANLAMVSIGTETDGSLMAPGSLNSIYSIKPTLGTPSVKGIIPISHNQDCVGPMARTVTDLAILLDAMILSDGRQNNKYTGSFTNCVVETRNNRPFRIGVMRYPFFSMTALSSKNLEFQLPQLNDLINDLKKSPQFQVLDPLSPEINLLKKISGAKEFMVLQHDFKHDLNDYLRTEVFGPYPYRRITSLKDIIKFNDEYPTPEGYNQDTLIGSEATDGIRNVTYLKARDENKNAAREALDSLLIKYNLDAVVSPTEPRIDAILDQELTDSVDTGFSLAAIAGYPSLNIPAGIGLKGVPFGIGFIGLPHSEHTLLQIGYTIEQLFPRRTRPKFLVF